MAAKTHRGQALIELVICILSLIAFVILAFELSQTAIQVDKKSRFTSSRSHE